MYIIDRYLLRQFVQTFAICFASLFGLYIVIEVFANLDTFINSGRQAGGILRFIAHFYSHRWLLLFDRTSGMLALVSAMFTVAWIQRHNEMTALMAAGVSRIRVLIPVILAVAAVSLLSAANRELMVPRYRNELARRPQDPLGDRPQDVKRCYDNHDVLLDGKCTYADRRRIELPNFLMPLALQKHGTQLVADNAYYLPPDGDRPGGYWFKGVREPKNIDTRESLSLNGQAVLITRRDRPDWLRPDECFLTSGVDFDQLTLGDAFKQLSSTGQLIAALRNLSLGYGADVRVAIHARIVQPLLDLTLLFLGLPLIVSRESRNVFLAMGMCMAVTVVFQLVEFGLQCMGGDTYVLLPAALAAWAPLMIFVPPAVWLSESLWQ
jgi:lipopolysaccharide export system permease protein